MGSLEELMAREETSTAKKLQVRGPSYKAREGRRDGEGGKAEGERKEGGCSGKGAVAGRRSWKGTVNRTRRGDGRTKGAAAPVGDLCVWSAVATSSLWRR